MAQKPAHPTSSSVVVTTSSPSPVTPAWLAPTITVLAVLRATSSWQALVRLQVPRRRAGTYAAIDFFLLLFAAAVAGLSDLTDFCKQAKPVSAALAATWGRDKLASRSALCRFMQDVRLVDVDALAEVVLTELLCNGLQGELVGGLFDRQNKLTVVFDDDGTYQGAQLRPLPTDVSRPPPQRRCALRFAKGHHGGAKRADVVATRTVLQQAHTHEWLGSWTAPGNGHPYEQLKPASVAVVRYLQARGLSAPQGLIRLDGFYGKVRPIATIVAAGLGYIARCADYRLLQLITVKKALSQPPEAIDKHPDTGLERAIWQVHGVVWTSTKDPSLTVTTRLLITRRASQSTDKPRVGKREGDYVYELFVTDRSPAGWTACDVLSLYFGRGGFESTLAEEDRESDLDKTASFSPSGQQCWVLLGQLAWNLRLRLGAAIKPPTGRQTLWAAAIAPEQAVETSNETRASSSKQSVETSINTAVPSPEHVIEQRAEVATSMAGTAPGEQVAEVPPRGGEHKPQQVAQKQAETQDAAESPPRDEPRGPARAEETIQIEVMSPAPARRPDLDTIVRQGRVAALNGRGAGRFGAGNFNWTKAGHLRCPAGKHLRMTKMRLEPGRWRVLFEAKATECAGCEHKLACRGRPSTSTWGRTVSVLVAREAEPTSPESSTEPPLSRPPTRNESPPPQLGASQPRVPSVAEEQVGPEAVVWRDVPARALRRGFDEQLRAQEVTVAPQPSPPTPMVVRLTTRDERAHRRQTWQQQVEKNARPEAKAVRVEVTGVPTAISYLLLKNEPLARAALPPVAHLVGPAPNPARNHASDRASSPLCGEVLAERAVG